MLLLIILLEAVVCRQDIRRNDEVIRGRAEGPEIGAENHDAECNVHIIMILLHPLLELISEILAETHIFNDRSEQHRFDKRTETHTSEHAL